VHGVDRAGEVGAEQVAQHGLADAARLAAQSDGAPLRELLPVAGAG
jgi:hypothetical protein